MSISLFSQTKNIRFDQLSIDNGLSHNLVLDIVQDQTGFLWFATQDGLNKYDGYNFTHYKNDPNDSTSIGENWITSIKIDSKGHLWLGTWGNGLNLLKKGSTKFIRFPHDEKDSTSISNNWIQKILVDRNDNIWIATWGGGLNFFNTESQKFTSFKFDDDNQNGISENNLYALYEDKDGSIWIGTMSKGICKFDPIKKEFKSYQNNSPSKVQRKNFITAIFEDSENRLLIGTFGDGLHLFDKNTGEFKKSELSNKNDANLITYILKDKRNRTWVCSDDNGVFQYNNEQKFLSVRNSNRYSSFNDNRIWSVYEDNTGLIWIGTFSSGIGVYKEANNLFGHISVDERDPNSISDNFVKSIYEDGNDLWIGTNEGISVVNRKTQKTIHLKHNPNNSNSLSHNRVRGILKDKKGNLWITTWGGGLNKYNPRSKKFDRFMHDEKNRNTISDNYARCIIQDYKGNIYIGTESGLNIYDPISNKFSFIKYNPEDSASISGNQITSLKFDIDGKLWIGTQTGLNLYDLETSENLRFLISETDKNSISNNRIRSIFIDKQQDVWITTLGGGINKYNRDDSTFKYFTEAEGLSNNATYSILEDKNNNLWISTNKGLSRFNKTTFSFKNYDQRDGLQSNEFNGGAAFLNEETGEMFFGGINGLNHFFPSQIKSNKTAPSIQLTNLKINYNEVNLDTCLTELKEIDLDYKQNYIYLEFAALDYTTPSKNQYSYMLEGLEEDWIKSNNKNFANYTNLDPGKYIFKVKGSNNDGIWSKVDKELIINIIPPFWMTWYFNTFIIIFILFTLISYPIIRQQRFNKRQLELEKLISKRTKDLYKSNSLLKEANLTKDKFMSIMAHDLKNPIGAIMNFSQLLYEDFKELNNDEKLEMISSIGNSSRKTLSLLENLLLWAQSQSHSISFSPTEVKLKELISHSISPYEFFATSKKIKIITDLDDSNLNADRYMLNTVIGNLVNNAIKFSPKNSSVTITGYAKNGNTVIKVKDEGIGIEKNKASKLFDADERNVNTGTDKERGIGLGLILCKEFIKQHNGKIEVESEIKKGSEFTIKIPKKQN